MKKASNGSQNLLIPISKNSRYHLKKKPKVAMARIEIYGSGKSFYWSLLSKRGVETCSTWPTHLCSSHSNCKRAAVRAKKLMAEAEVRDGD